MDTNRRQVADRRSAVFLLHIGKDGLWTTKLQAYVYVVYVYIEHSNESTYVLVCCALKNPIL